MREKSFDILSVAGYFLMLAGLFSLYFNNGLFVLSVPVILLQVMAILLMIWARVTFRARSFHLTAHPTEGGLVTTGPYKHIRHPIYASVLLFIWSGVAGNLSVVNALLGCVVSAGAFIRIFCEEILVRARYPEYFQYAEKTKRLIPYVF
jgi:protein-S-isoprenylcysteine O-methyltransferase Ste14